jgi:hypothetical protein
MKQVSNSCGCAQHMGSTHAPLQQLSCWECFLCRPAAPFLANLSTQLQLQTAEADHCLPAATEPAADGAMEAADTKPEFENDAIYQAMISAVKSDQPGGAPSSTSQPPLAGGYEVQSRPAVAAAPPQRPAPRTKVRSAFGEEEEEEKPQRRLIPIRYTEEEQRALEQQAPTAAMDEDEQPPAAAQQQPQAQQLQQHPGAVPHQQQAGPQQQPPAAAAAAPQSDPAALKRQLMASIPKDKAGVFAFPIKWDVLDRAPKDVKDRIAGAYTRGARGTRGEGRVVRIRVLPRQSMR